MIKDSFYQKIISLMPIASVEAMIVNEKNEILVLRRKNHPVKGEWWFAGGRIRKGETLEEALIREVKDETGLDIEIIKFIGVYSRIFRDRHDITLAYLCKCFNGASVVLNEEHSEYGFWKLDYALLSLNPMLAKVISDSRRV